MNRLKELRQEKGLSLRALSKKVDIPFSTLSSYEQEGSGARKLAGKNLNVLANFFDVTPLYLTGDSNIRSYNDFFELVLEKTKTNKESSGEYFKYSKAFNEFANLRTYELNKDFTNLYNSVHGGVSVVEDDKSRLPDLNEIIGNLDDYSKEFILSVIRQVFTNLVKDKLEMETDFDIDELIDLLDIDY